MSKSLINAIADRRTIYHLGNQPTLNNQRIIELISLAVKNVPSAFNNQSQRVVILFAQYHHRIWQIAAETLKARLTPERFVATEQRLKGFEAGYATILYFDDTKTTQEMMEKFPTYKDYFPAFALQANGMLQDAIWTLLESEGLGVNIQHYNPLIDEQVKWEFNLPAQWQLLAQMPLGNPTGAPGEKSFIPLEERLKILG